ncbi:complement C1q-like protein 3 isoform X1 [Heterodontus francisci]|uniref:complement C1q-like protein 3 isoform X1 n=1 Tax=Heterodontus francisci TaxID=7792 RepID=UPI00355B1DA9
MSNIGKVIRLCLLFSLCTLQAIAFDNCPGLSEITFQGIKDAIDKTKEIYGLQEKIQLLEEQVNTLQKYVPSVIFHAKVSDGRNPSGQQRIIYDSVVVNQGSAYNPSSGIFTAPVSGIYYFTYSLLGATTSEATALYLMKNEENQNYIHSILNTSQAQTASMPAILSLTKRDRVWVRLDSGFTWSGTGAMNFQGMLLEAEPE